MHHCFQASQGDAAHSFRSCQVVLGEATKFKQRVEVNSLEPFDDKKRSWSECFVTDGRINVANEVCFTLDCETWMKTLDWKRREILEAMIQGVTTTELSQRFKVSAGRISQYRREFYEGWKEYRNTYDKKHQNDDFIDELIRLAERSIMMDYTTAGIYVAIFAMWLWACVLRHTQ